MNNPEFTTPPSDVAPRQVWQQTVDAVLAQIKSQAVGLNPADAVERLNTFGLSVLPEKRDKPGWPRFLARFSDVLIYVLLAAAALTAIMGHRVDTLVILGVAVTNALIGHTQEDNAEKPLQGIRNMLSSDVRVQRNDKHEAIPTCDPVPGDIAIPHAGDRIPADTRLIKTYNLRVEKVALTGKSTVVGRITSALEGDLPLGDRADMVFSGTTVSAGNGIGVVIVTSAKTELDHVNQMMVGAEKHHTPLLVQVDKLGKAIFIIILAMMMALLTLSLALQDIPMGELLLSLISLAVAAIPEELPAIILIILSLGMQTVARKRAIVRKLPTVETLGAMIMICPDKTDTLTMGEMTIKAIITVSCYYRVEDGSHEPQRRILLERSDEPVQVQPDTVLETWPRAIDLCNDSQFTRDKRGLQGITGRPTGGALKVLAAKAQLPAVEAHLVAKISLDLQYKYMSTSQHIDGEARVLITGTLDVISAMYREQMSRYGAVPFEAHYREEEMVRLARQGLRMAVVIYKFASFDVTILNHEDPQEGLTFLGITGMMNPPRPEAIDAIHACQTTEARVKTIIGDHPQTAVGISQMLGITNSSQAMTSYQLEHMDDATLAKTAVEYDIFVHTSPKHKLRLVKALQDNGEVVGVIGDGINDASALRQADAGIAMGIKGTEVTREVADMVLTDGNFATIASSVEESRRVYDNLKKTVLFIIPTNLTQESLIIIALLAGDIVPLTPMLILWMNMATSATLSFDLTFEAAECNVMNCPPRKTGQYVTGGFAVRRVAFIGFMIAITAFILKAWLASRGHSPEFTRTVLPQMLVMAQWVYMINCRSSDSFSLSMDLLCNRGTWLVTGVLLLMQLVTIHIPLMQSMFGTEALPLCYWFITLVVGVAMSPVVEAEGRLTCRFRKTA